MRLALLGCVGLLAATLPALADNAHPTTLAASNQAGAPGSAPVQSVAPAAAAPMATTGSAALEIHTLRDLYNACTTRSDNPLYISATSLCAGYQEAVLDFHLLDTMGARHGKRKVCLPNPAPTRRQSIAGLIAWAQAAPQYMDEPAASAVLRYFINAYPCNRKTFQWSPPGPMQ